MEQTLSRPYHCFYINFSTPLTPNRYLNRCWFSINPNSWDNDKSIFPIRCFHLSRFPWTQDQCYLCLYGWKTDVCFEQSRRSSLVPIIMAGLLFGAKPLSGPMLAYHQLYQSKQLSGNFESKCDNFHSRKMSLKMSSANWRQFCLGLNGLGIMI